MRKGKKRLCYLALTVVLVLIEVCIARFVHDKIIRPYVGDILVVMCVWGFVRIFVPEGCRLLPLWVFLFAVFVEVLQYFEIVSKLGLSGNRFLSVLVGGTFDWVDIACYVAGCLILAAAEFMIAKRNPCTPEAGMTEDKA